MGWGQPHRPRGTEPMAEPTNNGKRRRCEELEQRMAELVAANTAAAQALPAKRTPSAAAVPVLKIEALVNLWIDGDPERELRFAVAYQEALAQALAEIGAAINAEAAAAALAAPPQATTPLVLPPRLRKV